MSARSKRKRSRRERDDPGERLIRQLMLLCHRQETRDVIRRDRAAVGRGPVEKIGIAQPTERGLLSDGDDVVSLIAQLPRELRVEVLIEEQPHDAASEPA